MAGVNVKGELARAQDAIDESEHWMPMRPDSPDPGVLALQAIAHALIAIAAMKEAHG